MKFPDKRALFTVKEVCHACGISRSTLLRLEDCGILTPFHVDPDTGYRYYDTQNVTTIGQYQRLQKVNLSRKEISDLYFGRVDSERFLQEQRQKLNMMMHFLDSYELCHDRSKDHSCSYVTLPATICRCIPITVHSLEECATFSYLAYESCVKEGYRMNCSEPLSVLCDDWHRIMDPPASGFDFTLCIPVIPDSEDDSKLQHFPSTDAFSILGFGDPSIIPGLWDCFSEEIKARKLHPSGPARMIVLIALYAGMHYKSEDFCYEMVVPIVEKEL